MRSSQPILVTPNPLLIAGVKEMLAAAGLPADPRVVAPEGLAATLAQAEGGLVILDGQALPQSERLGQLRRSSPGWRFVVWAAQPTADMLRIALDCGVHGLLSTRLALEEAANALLRICQGEKIFRFITGSDASPERGGSQLSERERLVLMALPGGASNAEIAVSLRTTPSTVKGCLARLFRKTGARNRRELAELGLSLLRAAEPPRRDADAVSFDGNWMLENS
jgi:DNA-binding NarL/FixJ family response regulator